MRVAIIGGAGGVGASAALNLVRSPEPCDVVLIGRRQALIDSHVMDLRLVCALGAGSTVRGGDMSDVAAADIVVLTASPPAAPTDLRDADLLANSQIATDLIEALPQHWPGLLLVVTNPVDAIVTWLRQRTGLSRDRVIGYTLNDSLRLRCAVAAEVGTHPAEVTAWVLGEHVSTLVPLWNLIEVKGELTRLTAEQRDAASEFLFGWFGRHASLNAGRSSTWSSGTGIAQMIAAIANDSGDVWPASVVLEGEYGHHDVALTVPISLGRTGVQQVYEWELEASARSKLGQAAVIVSESVGRLNAGGRSQR